MSSTQAGPVQQSKVRGHHAGLTIWLLKVWQHCVILLQLCCAEPRLLCNVLEAGGCMAREAVVQRLGQ